MCSVNSYDPPPSHTLEMSDNIICNNMKYYDFYGKKKDDLAFCWQMHNCNRLPEKVINDETMLWRGHKEKNCDLGYMKTRGGNIKEYLCKEMKKPMGPAGYDNYNAQSLQDYLLVPCKQNTFKNYINCDDKKCCSIRHQMFMNHTKRKGSEKI